MKSRASRRIVEALARKDLRARPIAAPTRDLRLRETDLTDAVVRGELLLHYQPIVDLRSGESRRVEALLRWRHPELGLLMPRDFMPLAVSATACGAITRWVIDAVVSQWLAWREHGDPVGISVNLFGPELAHVESLVAEFRNIGSGALTFEAPPRVLVALDPTVRTAVVRLSAAGARIALDDVGPQDVIPRSLGATLDEIKISRSLVQRAVLDAPARADLRNLVELARDHRLRCVAVGVESKAAHDLVGSLGCDEAQGYWVSRPLVPDRLGPARRWAVGLAFGGALAFAAHTGGKAAAAITTGIHAPLATTGFLSSICCLDLPTLAPGPEGSRAAVLDHLGEQTGLSFASHETNRAAIFAESSLSSSVRVAIAQTADQDIEELEREFGHSFAGKPSIYVFATRTSFAVGLQRVFGVRGADAGILAAANGGITLPRQAAIVINLQNLPKNGDLAIVRHELTHALVHEVIGPESTLPAWFDEGLATLEQGRGITDDASAARKAAVALSLLSQDKTSLHDLRSLTEWAQRNAALGGQAYTVSAEAVRLVEQSVSREGLVRILEATSGGGSFAAAFAAETGETLADFERAFPARLAVDQGTARILQTKYEDGVRWTLAGFTPEKQVAVTIEGAGYQLVYEVTTDRYGMYQAVFGETAPKGEYTLRASHPGATAVTLLRT